MSLQLHSSEYEFLLTLWRLAGAVGRMTHRATLAEMTELDREPFERTCGRMLALGLITLREREYIAMTQAGFTAVVEPQNGHRTPARIAPGRAGENRPAHSLLAAAFFSREVGRLETESAPGESRSSVVHSATACLALATDAVTAWIHDHLREAIETTPVLADGKNRTRHLEKIERRDLRRKVQTISKLLSLPEPDWGQPVCKNMERIMQLQEAVGRNRPSLQASLRNGTLAKWLDRILPASESPPSLAWACRNATRVVVDNSVAFICDVGNRWHMSGLPDPLDPRLAS